MKTDCWKNVTYLISSLISNYFILNGEILTKTLRDFSVPEKKKLGVYLRFQIVAHQAWSILRNRHRKLIRIDSKSIQFRLESIQCKIWKSQDVTYFFDSISIFILACFQKNRCYFDIYIENTWKLWNNRLYIVYNASSPSIDF